MVGNTQISVHTNTIPSLGTSDNEIFMQDIHYLDHNLVHALL